MLPVGFKEIWTNRAVVQLNRVVWTNKWLNRVVWTNKWVWMTRCLEKQMTYLFVVQKGIHFKDTRILHTVSSDHFLNMNLQHFTLMRKLVKLQCEFFVKSHLSFTRLSSFNNFFYNFMKWSITLSKAVNFISWRQNEWKCI